MSELYGRLWPLFLGYAIFAILQIPVAVAQNLETIIICRFLIGFFGCSSLAVIGGALADFWGPVDRAIAIALFSSATFLGPIFGPIMYVHLTQFPTHYYRLPLTNVPFLQWKFPRRFIPRLALDCMDYPDCFFILWDHRLDDRPRDIPSGTPPTTCGAQAERNS